MQVQVDIAIVAKCRKLLARAKDDASTQGEAEMAMAAAQALMMKHNISVATVEASHDTSTVVKRAKEKAKGRAAYQFQQDLMRTIGTANFVHVGLNEDYVPAGRGYRRQATGYTLVGRQENVVAAQVMFDYLAGTIERLARDYVGGDHRLLLSNEAISFKKGCAETLGARIRRQHREEMAAQRAEAEAARASSGGTALVVIMEDFAEAEECANTDFRLNLEPGTTARQRMKVKHMSAAWQKVTARLAQNDVEGLDDEALLTQVATEAAMEVLDASGLTGKDLEDAMDYAVHSTVKDQVKEAAYKSGKAKRPKVNYGRSYRSYGKTDNTNYRAHSAGSEAGKSVSLNRQVGDRPSSKLVK